MGLLCIGLLDLTTMNIYPNDTKISCLVLLRNIIEIDCKNYWGNIDQTIKDKIKQKALNLLLNNANNYSLNVINKVIFLIEQLVHTIEDFNENWLELIDLTNNLLKLSFPKDINFKSYFYYTINILYKYLIK